MFVFGSAEDIAQSLCESIKARTPGLVNKPLDEMTLEEMKRMLTIFRMAAHEARQVGSSEDSMETLLEWHDDVLRALVAVDERLRRRVLSGKYQYPRKRTQANRLHYTKIAEEGA